MLHLRQAPYSLSLGTVIRLLAILAADEKRSGNVTSSPVQPPSMDLGPEAALQAQIGRPLTREELIRLREQTGDMN